MQYDILPSAHKQAEPRQMAFCIWHNANGAIIYHTIYPHSIPDPKPTPIPNPNPKSHPNLKLFNE